MDKTKLLISLALSAALAGCGGSDDDDSSGGGNTGGGGSGGGGGGGSSLTLTSADADGVAPCPNQAILTDTAEFAALKTAMQSGTWTFLDLLYNAGDADNFKKKGRTFRLVTHFPSRLYLLCSAGRTGATKDQCDWYSPPCSIQRRITCS